MKSICKLCGNIEDHPLALFSKCGSGECEGMQVLPGATDQAYIMSESMNKWSSKYMVKRSIGENVIKAEAVLSAWLNYCRESRIYRILEFFNLK